MSSMLMIFSLKDKFSLKSRKASLPMIMSYLQSVLIILASIESKTRLDMNSGKHVFSNVTFECDTNCPAMVWLFIFSHRSPHTLVGRDECLMNELLDPKSNKTSKGLSHLLFWIMFAVSILYGIKCVTGIICFFWCFLFYIVFVFVLDVVIDIVVCWFTYIHYIFA